MTAIIDSIIEAEQARTSERKKAEIERSTRGKRIKGQLREIERDRIELSKRQAEFETGYFSNQRERQAANRYLMKALDDLQVAVATAATEEAEMILADIDETLLDTLDRDDHVDIESFKKQGVFPEFTSIHLQPASPPKPLSAGPRPTLAHIDRPTGLNKLLGGKKRYERDLSKAQDAHLQALEAWEAESALIPARQLEQITEYQRQEAVRERALERERREYDLKKQEFEAQVLAHNSALDDFIAQYEAGNADAVDKYLDLVFARSLYPMNLPLGFSFEFHEDVGEMRIQIRFPSPSTVPNVKAYKYVKSKGEVQEVPVSQKEARERYLGLVENLGLRILHEVWESDRPKHIKTVSMSGVVDHIDPATGQDTHTQVMMVAVDRATFERIDLSRATPAESLRYLGAVVSKNPFGYVAVTNQPGVRGR